MVKTARLLVVFALLAATAALAAPVVKDGDRVAIAGDSITEQKQYSRFMEAYLLACSGLKDVKVFQFGWGGEQAPGYAARMENDTWSWKPTVLTTCYGMNDGHYGPYNATTIGKPYRAGMEKIAAFFKAKGVKMILGAPGVVDSDTFRPTSPGLAAVYNQNLGELGKISEEVAAQNGAVFADVHAAMMDAMAKAKAKLGDKHVFAGGDGVHPSPNGQLVMAYAFLKAMGFDGKIGAVDMDFAGQTTASEGHHVLSQKPGSVELESSRYPFCFTAQTAPAASVLPFAPFQQDLNRFELKVRNLPKDKAEVVWGDSKKTFTKAELEQGINLADAFLNNPFCPAFAKLDSVLSTKQNYETWMIKGLIDNFRMLDALLPESKTDAKIKESVDCLRERLFARQAELDAKAREAVVPVKHQITVTPLD